MSTRLEDIISRPNAGPTVRPKIVCSDGFTVSVQASWAHYCQDSHGERPDYLRASTADADAVLPYTTVEVGYPSARPEPWLCSDWAEGWDRHEDHGECDGWVRYAESENEPTGVFAFVPAQMVRDLIAAHGGEVQ